MTRQVLLVTAIFVASVLALQPGTASSQAATATLSGTIVDETGATVPDVAVSVLNVATRQQRDTMTSKEGQFVLPLLSPGRYTLTAIRDGFTPLQVRDVVLNVNDQIALRLQLKVAPVGESVTVTVEPPRVNTSPAVSTVMDRQFVENLPLNGRSFQSLISLTPGVVVTPATITEPGQFSVNGQRENANYFTVDGVSANIGAPASNFNIGQTSVGSTPGVNAIGGTHGLVSVDALQEFTIQTSTYAAEFGRQPGGQITLVTRSGTNEFHGSLFEYLRNDAFDANDWFANRAGQRKPPLRQHQFGGTLGGPLRRNHAFFFGSYEGLRVRLPQTLTRLVPSRRLRELAPLPLRNVLGAFPLPTGPEALDAAGQPTGTAPVVGSFSDPQSVDATSIRVDQRLGQRLTLFGRVAHTPSSTTSRFLTSSSVTNAVNTDTVTVGTTQLWTSRLTNDIRANYSRTHSSQLASMDDFGGAVPVSLRELASGRELPPQGNAILIFNFAGMSASRHLSNGATSDNEQRQLSIVDNMTLVYGSHQFKWGVDYRRLAPTWTGVSLNQGMLFSSQDQVVRSIGTLFGFTQESARPLVSNLSAYGQDTWRLSDRLTLTYGLRWELNPPPSEADDKDNLVLTVSDVEQRSTARVNPPGTPVYETTFGNVAPRLGISYQLRSSPGDETTLRGGIGAYYDLGSGPATDVYAFGYPFYRPVPTTPNVLFPLPADANIVLPPVPVSQAPATQTLYGFAPNLAPPRTTQWNVALDRALGASQHVTVSYVGAAGRNLLLLRRFGYPPEFLNIRHVTNEGVSDYRSLQIQFQRRLRHGLQALLSYTWAHATDTASDDLANTLVLQGDADFDVRHNLAAALSCDLPAPSSSNSGARLLRDWSVDASVHAQSAYPFTPVADTFLQDDGRFVSRRPNAVPGVPPYQDDPNAPGGRIVNRAAFSTPPGTEQGTVGRNTLRGLPLIQVDLAVRRRIRLTHGVALQLRAEAFNLFNRPNFGLPERDLTSPFFGRPTQMLGRSLGGLSALYQLGGPRSVQLSARVTF